MRLSPHFTLDEFARSGTARARKIDNTPPEWVVVNLKRLATELEKVRELCDGKPLAIKSGFRCKELNVAVGGSLYSYHMLGLAADFDPPGGFTHDQLQHMIDDDKNIIFDKIIEESAKDGAHWLHFQVPRAEDRPRRLALDAQLERQGGAIMRITAG